jgi:hypothetical protein
MKRGERKRERERGRREIERGQERDKGRDERARGMRVRFSPSGFLVKA